MIKLEIPRHPQSPLIALPRGDDLPERAHMLFWDHLVFKAREEEHRRVFWYQRDFGRRVPFLVAEEGEGGEEGKRGGDEPREGCERVFED
jgi:hypothetical protein